MLRYILAALVLLAIGFTGYRVLRSDTNTDPAQTKETQTREKELTFGKIESDVQAGAYLIDVRTAQEFNSGHFKPAINWNVEDMDAGRFPEIAKDSKIYVYCRSGNRSAQAKSLLEQAGFSNVIDLGGLADVQAIGGQLG